jgi:hypothetical protein
MNARTLSNKLAALTLLLMSNSWTIPAAWAETQTVDTAKIEQRTKPHLHIYAGQTQIAAVNFDGSGHDGYSGTNSRIK